MTVSPHPFAFDPGSASANRHWYVVQTQPRREALALLHLRRQNFDAFCPLRARPRKVARRLVSALSPFFPSYLFVNLDLERDQWRSINGTIGVLRIVSFGSGGRPASLPAGFVERLASLSDSEGIIRLREELEVGSRVRIVGGPFDDLCGILGKPVDKDRVTILLNLLSKETRVQIRRDLLIAA